MTDARGGRRATRAAPERDMVATPFAEILGRLVARVPGAYAAVLVDQEGETVDYTGLAEPFDLRIAAAEVRIALDLVGRAARAETRWMVIRGERRSVVARRLPEGYAFVVLLRRRAGFTASRRAYDVCERELAEEAGWREVRPASARRAVSPPVTSAASVGTPRPPIPRPNGPRRAPPPRPSPFARATPPSPPASASAPGLAPRLAPPLPSPRAGHPGATGAMAPRAKAAGASSEGPWWPVDVVVDRRGRPVCVRVPDAAGELPVEVLGSVMGLAPRERGFRVRTEDGEEVTLVREARRSWFADARMRPGGRLSSP